MKQMIKNLIEWFLYIVGYGFILISVSVLFPNTMYIDNAYFGLWGFLASTIIFLINKWFKPFLVWLTIPLTAITFGLFYPFINVFILYIVHFILGNHFSIHGLFMGFVIALLISFINFLMEHFIFKPFIVKEMNHE